MGTCYLVIGTPRSGTSAVAGILHHLGVFMGERFMSADEWNPHGYYQDLEFEELIVPALRGEFPAIETVACDDSWKQRIRGLASSRSAQWPVWGLKSNRIIYFLGSFLDGAGPVKLLTTTRAKSESAASWQARTPCDPATAAALIDRFAAAMDAAFLDCQVTPDLSINYSELLADPKVWVGRIADLVGVPATSAAEQWIDQSLRRFNHG